MAQKLRYDAGPQESENLSLDDRFIPIRAEDLAELLAADAKFGVAAATMREVAESMTLIIDQEIGAFERRLAHAYAPLNPDRDTVLVDASLAGEGTGEAEHVMAMLGNLMWQANFEEMDEAQVVAAVEAANTRGMKIKLDPDLVAALRVWARGHGLIKQMRRPLLKPWRKEEVEVPVLKRLVVAIQMRDNPNLYIKMFKEIPIRDLEALMPHARVKMGPKEMLTLTASGGGAVWTIATKIITTGLAAAGQLLYVLAAPLVMLSWKTFSSYRRAIKDRDSERTRNLYYQNLANNASAIHMLTTVVAQEEVKEALVGYAFCHLLGSEPSEEPVTRERLDEAAERYLGERLGVPVNFDMPDAVETLDRFGLWEDRDAMRVVPPDRALAILEQHRLERRSADYHSRLSRDAST